MWTMKPAALAPQRRRPPASDQAQGRRPPASASLGQLADMSWLAGHTGLVFHTGAQAAAAASLREGGE